MFYKYYSFLFWFFIFDFSQIYYHFGLQNIQKHSDWNNYHQQMWYLRNKLILNYSLFFNKQYNLKTLNVIAALHFFNNVCYTFKTIHLYKSVLMSSKLTTNIVLNYFSVKYLNDITRVIQHITHTHTLV